MGIEEINNKENIDRKSNNTNIMTENVVFSKEDIGNKILHNNKKIEETLEKIRELKVQLVLTETQGKGEIPSIIFYEEENKRLKKENNLEELKLPEIVSEKEDGLLIYSLIQKGLDSSFGDTDSEISKKVSQYFNDNPINNEIKNTLKELKSFGLGDEQMSNLSLAYNKPERLEKIIKMFKQYRPDIEDHSVIYNKFFNILNNFSNEFSQTSLNKEINSKIELDISKRNENKKQIEDIENDIIKFFKPSSENFNIMKINFVPTNPILKENYGRNFSSFEGEQIIISNINNIENQKHELSHGIINPIVSRLFEQLSQGEKEKIKEFASENLKNNYGENPLYLLREEFVKAYVESFSVNKKEEGDNKLRNLILKLYTDYNNEKDLNFEEFILNNFKNYFTSH